MNRTRTAIIWIIVAIQFFSAMFFITGTLAGYFGYTPRFYTWEQREFQEPLRALGLGLGVVLGWIVLRRSLRRAEAAEEKLHIASAAFMDILAERFDGWQLTAAERDVALFAIKGFSIQEIAAMRGTSQGTVKAQTNAIYRKAGVAGRPQLLGLFIEDLMDDTLLPAPA